MPGFLLRLVLLLAVEGAGALLLGEVGAPWIPVLLGVFVLGSAIPHGTSAEFPGRFLIASAAVGVALAGAASWQDRATPEAWPAQTATAVLLLFQTAALLRLTRGRG
ncbi:hypothetical protein [Streptomyces sp. RerS4]|uniref:hypothetical protein n=1 Tax=Streptomyces sp. RerS4 TaxID=2942449 RepID=UPI00201C27B1|nr:hypothetical protein [Streptomyces sp. RerS4]UQX00693.1 hypothetical protein M4D82_09260 [Streptomyces sp. RerS4]